MHPGKEKIRTIGDAKREGEKKNYSYHTWTTNAPATVKIALNIIKIVIPKHTCIFRFAAHFYNYLSTFLIRLATRNINFTLHVHIIRIFIQLSFEWRVFGLLAFARCILYKSQNKPQRGMW